MATKSTRKSTLITAGSMTTTTPQSSYVSSTARPASPLSPTRLSRLQEKEELQHLNDRLATYIERVRQLESENSFLNMQVQNTQETVTREVTSIKSMYENELGDARKLLDETAREKARLQIENSKLRKENEELAAKLAKKDKDCSTAEKNAAYYESKMQDAQNRLTHQTAEKKRTDEENKELRSENDKLAKQLGPLRKQLEEETLARVDFENRLQSMKEELHFKEQLFEQQITETKTRKQIEITQIDGKLQEQFEQKLAESLRELREAYEMQMRTNREEMEAMYESKLQDVKKLSEMNLGSAAQAREELRQTKVRIESLTSKIEELENENAALTKRVKQLELQLDDERNSHMARIVCRDEEIRQLQELLAQQFREYQDLMDIKIALDMEIAAYRKLLESEESRLNISVSRQQRESQQRSTPLRRTPVTGGRPLKRKRTVLHSSEEMTANFVSSASAKGEVEIYEQDTDGKFVKLFNKGEKDINVGGWQLVRKAGEQEMTYKFHRTTNIKSNQYITVWSADTETTHNPPSDLVMKQKWYIGDTITTTLINNNAEEMANRETTKQMLSTSILRSGEHGGYLEDVIDEGDPNNPERCVLM